MLKFLALFTLLALSFADQGWSGTWNVTSEVGPYYCRLETPGLYTNVLINVINDTALFMNGTDPAGQPASWILPWGNNTYNFSGCETPTNCIDSSLQFHAGQAHGKITWYCNHDWNIGRYITLVPITDDNVISVDDDDKFLSIIS
jgi:hypothetical protein